MMEVSSDRNELLEAVHDIMREALRAFDALCKRHGVEYWLDYGTLLGAARHGGFIPWDDDLDLGIMRAEYEKLRLVPAPEWEEVGLKLVDPKDEEPRHDKTFPRVYLDATRVQSYCDLEWHSRETGEVWSTSMMIDLFVFDFVPEDEGAWLGRRRRVLDRRKPYKYQKLHRVGKSAKSRVKAAGAHALYSLKGHFRTDAWRGTAEECERIARAEHRGRIGCYYDSEIANTYIPDEFFPLVNLLFEGMELPCPRCWENRLVDNYGDYMTPPPEDRRVHIDFIYADLADRGIFVLDTAPGSLGAIHVRQLTEERSNAFCRGVS